MKTSELVQVWQHLLLRRGSGFAFIEIREIPDDTLRGEILRGPISGIIIQNETLTIRTSWTATRQKNSNQWRSRLGDTIHIILDDFASEPREQADGSVYFRSSFQDNCFYPANHNAVRGFKKP